MNQTFFFSALEMYSKIYNILLMTAELKKRHLQDYAEEWHQIGWTRSTFDIHPIFTLLNPLSVKIGWVLRMYLYNNVRTVGEKIWALPVDAPFPEPEEFSHTRYHRIPEPCPPLAQSPMSAIVSDDTPESYLIALFLHWFLKDIFNPNSNWIRMMTVFDYNKIDDYPPSMKDLKGKFTEMTFF